MQYYESIDNDGKRVAELPEVPATAPIEAQEAKCGSNGGQGIGASHDCHCTEKLGHKYKHICECGALWENTPHPEATQGDELEEILHVLKMTEESVLKAEGKLRFDPYEAAKTSLLAYLNNTATRMAVEARLDEIENIKFIDNKGNELHTPFVQFRSTKDGLLLTWDERLAALQAQLKEEPKS